MHYVGLLHVVPTRPDFGKSTLTTKKRNPVFRYAAFLIFLTVPLNNTPLRHAAQQRNDLFLAVSPHYKHYHQEPRHRTIPCDNPKTNRSQAPSQHRGHPKRELPPGGPHSRSSPRSASRGEPSPAPAALTELPAALRLAVPPQLQLRHFPHGQAGLSMRRGGCPRPGAVLLGVPDSRPPRPYPSPYPSP